MLIFTPETVLRWHRELVRCKRTFRLKAKPGKPEISSELENLILCLAKENPRWRYYKIKGELLKLGHNLSASSVRNLLKRLGQYKDQILACDLFTVETNWLKTMYVLFFMVVLATYLIHQLL